MAKQETKNEAIVEDVNLEMASEEVEKAAEEMIENITNPVNMRPIKLKKPIKNHSEEIRELTFDFDKLTTKDALEIENELIGSGKNPAMPAYNGEYLLRLALRSCEQDVDLDFFMRLSIVDFNRVESKMRFFLLGSAT